MEEIFREHLQIQAEKVNMDTNSNVGTSVSVPEEMSSPSSLLYTENTPKDSTVWIIWLSFCLSTTLKIQKKPKFFSRRSRLRSLEGP